MLHGRRFVCYKEDMTLAEIQKRYEGQWVLIEFHQLDANLEVIEGDVLAAAPTKEDVYKRLLTVERGKTPPSATAVSGRQTWR